MVKQFSKLMKDTDSNRSANSKAGKIKTHTHHHVLLQRTVKLLKTDTR